MSCVIVRLRWSAGFKSGFNAGCLRSGCGLVVVYTLLLDLRAVFWAAMAAGLLAIVCERPSLAGLVFNVSLSSFVNRVLCCCFVLVRFKKLSLPLRPAGCSGSSFSSSEPLELSLLLESNWDLMSLSSASSSKPSISNLLLDLLKKLLADRISSSSSLMPPSPPKARS